MDVLARTRRPRQPFDGKRPANCIFSTISLQVIFAEKSYDKEREGRFNAGYDSQVA
jgi:hypothetical protein